MTVTKDIDFRLVSRLSAALAYTYRVIPVEEQGDQIMLWGEAESRRYLPQLSMLLNQEVVLTEVSKEVMDRQLATYYPQGGQGQVQRPNGPMQGATSDIVQLVEDMFRDAVAMGASDIHVERYETQARVRFRWEGQLLERFEVALDQYNAVVSRLKILAELDIAERRLPQDGRIQLPNDGQPIDLRVSTIPSKYGEKVVMRLLTRSHTQLQLSKLGLSGAELTAFEQAIQSPNGIVLITGPTGSGKTTTLYATLSRLNQPHSNILTVEDPIEYNLSGINQVQVKQDIGLTFDKALRAFLRQDPDIIMVGEIRDTPTAQIAIRAALTGHLVFSTLHTNTSWDAISRLTDMGVEPYLLAAALRMIVAQRLVRVLCTHCKAPTNTMVSDAFQAHYGLQQHWQAVGCKHCHFTGYKGRKAVFEVLPIDAAMAKQIKRIEQEDGPPKMNFPSLTDNVAKLVQAGETSLAEALLHAKQP